MSSTDVVMELINTGRLSPMPKQPSTDDPLYMITLPDENIRWFGQLDADISMFGSTGGSKYTTFDVLVGASEYRLVFFLEKGILKSSFLSRSYWFEVDFDKTVWNSKKGLKKRQYIALHLAPPAYKKGVMSREIVIANQATRSDGKQETTFECTLSSLKWLNPQNRKFEKGKGNQLHQQILAYFRKRQPVTFLMLCLLVEDPERLDELFFTAQPAEGQAIKVEPPVPKTEPRLSPVRNSCPSCGSELRPNALFCGNCGTKFNDNSQQPNQISHITECPSCGNALRQGVQFCGKCGAKLDAKGVEPTLVQPKVEPEICEYCSKPVENGWKACPFCGQQLSSTA